MYEKPMQPPVIIPIPDYRKQDQIVKYAYVKLSHKGKWLMLHNLTQPDGISFFKCSRTEDEMVELVKSNPIVNYVASYNYTIIENQLIFTIFIKDDVKEYILPTVWDVVYNYIMSTTYVELPDY